MRSTRSRLKVADQVWIAAARLHHASPSREDFTIKEIMASGREIDADLRPSFHVHVVLHCVANRAPNPARHRMLVETGRSRRRLFRQGDAFHPDREGGRILPELDDLDPEFLPLVEWYRSSYAATHERGREIDPLLALRGSGRALWAAEPPDRYVASLREGWS